MTIKPTPINEQALDKAAREGYAVRCKTNGPRVLDQYASPDIMRKQLDEARVIVSAYLDALSVPAAEVVGEPVAWTSVGQLKAVAEGMNATITKNGDEFMNIPLYAFNLSESPQEAFARWLNDGPKLAKSAGVYVGISVKPAPPALGGQP